MVESVMRARTGLATALLAGIVLAVAACGDKDKSASGPDPKGGSAPRAADTAGDELPPSQLETQLPPQVRDRVLTPFTGDLDALVKRRMVRIGVTFNRTFYFLDKGVQRGVAYEYGRLVEERLNKYFKTGTDDKVHVVFIPLPRNLLLPALADGKVDLVAAQVTVRPELQKIVDFTNPTRMNVSEILVTGPGQPPLATVADLSGREVFVRELGSYHESLVALNQKFKTDGKPPVEIRLVPENLEDDDLLEMVNAGLIPATVVDDFLANFWAKIFPEITVHQNVAVRTGGTLAIAIRKNSPQLSKALNTFMGNYGLGTAFGNIVERKYLVSTTYAKSAASEAERKKFQAVVQLFRKYSDQYKVDYLLMAAQGYQESQLNQNAKSAVGAIGIMQVMPATGAEMMVGDIRIAEANVHAGTKYMDQLMAKYLNDAEFDETNRTLFAFACYNAGPGNIRKMRAAAAERGLDDNKWFNNVELVTAEKIGIETTTYVRNIYKYFVAYRLMTDVEQMQRKAREGVQTGK